MLTTATTPQSTEVTTPSTAAAQMIGRATRPPFAFVAERLWLDFVNTDGFLKLLFDPNDQRILGVSIVGEGACELIHIAASVMTFGGTLDYFIQGVFNYPALCDAYKYAAYDGLQALARRRAKMPGLPSAPDQRAVKT